MKIRLALFAMLLGCLAGSPKLHSAPASADSSPATPPAQTPPYGQAVPGKPGFVTSPYAPDKGYIDVRGFPKDTEVKDPYSGKLFLVPDPGSTSAAPAAPASETMADAFQMATVDFHESSAKTILDSIGARAGIKIHAPATAPNEGNITLLLKNASASSAFLEVAQAANLKVTFQDDGVYFTPK